MKKLLVAISLMLAATAVYAACTTTTIFLPDGRTMICTTCCYAYGNCTTTCF